MDQRRRQRAEFYPCLFCGLWQTGGRDVLVDPVREKAEGRKGKKKKKLG